MTATVVTFKFRKSREEEEEKWESGSHDAKINREIIYPMHRLTIRSVEDRKLLFEIAARN